MNISDHSLPWLEFDASQLQDIADRIRPHTRRAEYQPVSDADRVRRETEDALREGLTDAD